MAQLLRAPSGCLTQEELKLKVEDLQKALAELSLKELAAQRAEMAQREEAVRQREVAVSQREEEVAARESLVAKREKADPREALSYTPTPSRSPAQLPVASHVADIDFSDTATVRSESVCDGPTSSFPVPPAQQAAACNPALAPRARDIFSHAAAVREQAARDGQPTSPPWASREARPTPPALHSQLPPPAGTVPLFTVPPTSAATAAEVQSNASSQPPTPQGTQQQRQARLSLPNTGSASRMKAVFEQRAVDQHAPGQHSSRQFHANKRQSNGSTSSIHSGCSSAREARRTAPELTASDAVSAVSSATPRAGPWASPAPKAAGLASTTPITTSTPGPAPKVSLQELLRQDKAKVVTD